MSALLRLQHQSLYHNMQTTIHEHHDIYWEGSSPGEVTEQTQVFCQLFLRDFNFDFLETPAHKVLNLKKELWFNQCITMPTTVYWSHFDRYTKKMLCACGRDIQFSFSFMSQFGSCLTLGKCWFDSPALEEDCRPPMPLLSINKKFCLPCRGTSSRENILCQTWRG